MATNILVNLMFEHIKEHQDTRVMNVLPFLAWMIIKMDITAKQQAEMDQDFCSSQYCMKTGAVP